MGRRFERLEREALLLQVGGHEVELGGGVECDGEELRGGEVVGAMVNEEGWCAQRDGLLRRRRVLDAHDLVDRRLVQRGVREGEERAHEDAAAGNRPVVEGEECGGRTRHGMRGHEVPVGNVPGVRNSDSPVQRDIERELGHQHAALSWRRSSCQGEPTTRPAVASG